MDPHPGVADRNEGHGLSRARPRPEVRLRCGRARRSHRRSRPPPRLDRQRAAARHGVPTVDAEVHDRLLELRRVDEYVARLGPQDDRKLDGGADQALDHRDRLVDAGVHIYDPDVAPGGLAEREQLPRQLRGPIRSSNDLPEIGRQLGVAGVGDPRQLGVAVDGLKQVVEVVGDGSRQLAERLHLLGLAKLSGSDLELLDKERDLQGSAYPYAQGLVGECLHRPHLEDGEAQGIVLEEERLHDRGAGSIDWQQPVQHGGRVDRGIAKPIER